MTEAIRIQLLAYPGAQESALWGMRDLFGYASLQALGLGHRGFMAEVLYAPAQGADVVILPPALSLEPPSLPTGWTEPLISLHAGGALLASICSGAFLLAETGMLNTRRVTTHWRHASAFRHKFPEAIVDSDRLLVDLGDIVTAGGVMAWTDLSLHLIERFAGRKLMLDVARMFVLDPPEREQSYYAAFTPMTGHGDANIATVQAMMQDTPGAALSIASLAQAARLSERSFLRRFKQATGLTPLNYLQHLRVEAARSRLELTRDSFERIAWDLGYGDAAGFRRVFQRVVGLAPSAYRNRFGQGSERASRAQPFARPK